jgi:hypothetical protein
MYGFGFVDKLKIVMFSGSRAAYRAHISNRGNSSWENIGLANRIKMILGRGND